MAIVSTSWSSGTLRTKNSDGSWPTTTKSCVGVAGQGLPSAFYYAHGILQIEIRNDGVYIKQNSLTIEQNGITNTGEDTWTFQGLYISKNTFTLEDGPNGPSNVNGKKVYNSGKISHNYDEGVSRHYSWLSSGDSTGWQKIANNINELEHNQSKTEIYLYAGGLIDFTATPTNNISIEAEKITLQSNGTPGISSLFAYFPWQRRIDNEWKSLNRNGSDSTTVGLFRMISNYNPCLNRTDDQANSHGFTYNNGWQVSPKSGQGA